jgi:hypothetical protein
MNVMSNHYGSLHRVTQFELSEASKAGVPIDPCHLYIVMARVGGEGDGADSQRYKLFRC